MKDSISLLIHALLAGMLAAAGAGFTGCMLENPGPDPYLYRRFNVYDILLYGSEGWPFLRLDLERRDQVTRLYARGVEGAHSDSAEFYVLGTNTDYYYALPVLIPTDFEVHARLKIPNGDDSLLIDSSIFELRSDIREVHWRDYLLREWKGDSLTGDRLGGLYAGVWSIRNRQHKLQSGPLKGLIDASGNFKFTFANPALEGQVYLLESLMGLTYGDSLLRPQSVNGEPMDYRYPKGSPFLDAKLITNGDSLQALIPADTLYGDTLSLRCARVEAP